MRKVLLAVALMLAIGCLAGFYLLTSSRSFDEQRYVLDRLSSRVIVKLDERGVPKIIADSREDAFHVLGFLTARDRLFQMDLLRRHMSGRLAEVLGPALLESDRHHRIMGFEQVAIDALHELPLVQRRVLEAYASGVNQALRSFSVLPPEFLLLGYSPDEWQPKDSLLVILGMEEDLGWTANAERRNTIMEATLPESVRRFFMPPIDSYTGHLLNGEMTSPPVPKQELSALLTGNDPDQLYATNIIGFPQPKGSNGWVVGSSKTWDGRAILANDMHLSLRVPNIWYRAEIRYDDVQLIGLTLPGVPLLVVGSNGKAAWGFTNIEGDYVDLVMVELDPDNPDRYRTEQGFVEFGERKETVRVKDQDDDVFTVKTTVWGPVLDKPLLAKPVAVHWTALDPKATDLGLLELDKAATVMAAQAVFNRSGGPPLNALIADHQGNIGWTYCGKIPKRIGLDGSVSRSWSDGTKGWEGYIPTEELPRLLNPPSGFIVNANQRMLNGDYPYRIGDDFANGYRAYRISERLALADNLTERDMLDLQLDTKTEFYRFYQQLALTLLSKTDANFQSNLKERLSHWDGFAERDSEGLAVLIEFRKLLMHAVIAPFLATCRQYDPYFEFSSAMADIPLQQLLKTKFSELLPDKIHYQDWDSFLLDLLIKADSNVLKGQAFASRESLVWGNINRVEIDHPFSSSLPWLQDWLNMPHASLPGCVHCVRMYTSGYGASERLVVSPGNEVNGILHMPGGQSGHPLSAHYRDQQPFWVEGLPSSLKTASTLQQMEFFPENISRE